MSTDREARYAEAICEWEHSAFRAEEHHRRGGPAKWHANGAAAVMAVADAEQAELRAEVERMSHLVAATSPEHASLVAALESVLDDMFWVGEPIGFAVPVRRVRAALAGGGDRG